MKINKTIENVVRDKVGRTIINPLNELVDQNLNDITTTIGSYVVRNIRGKFQRSITFTVGLNYADKWMEEALYGILYKYNNIKKGSRLELTNKKGIADGTGMYYQLDDGTHNLKYRGYNILLAIQTNSPASMTGRISMQRIYTIITYDLSPEFVLLFEKDMIAHRNSLLQIKSDATTVNVYQDLHESDGYTYWEKTVTLNKRRIGTIYLPHDTKKQIVDTINEFFGSKEYYKRHGIAHNLKILLYGPPGPQPVSEEIPTPTGIKSIGSIVPGDYVFSLSGQPTLVEEVYEYKDLDVYEIQLDDGRKIRCGEDHKWPTIDNDGCFVEKTVKEMIEESVGTDGTTSFRIPIGDEVEFEGSNVPMNPWIVGALIGSVATNNICQGKHVQIKTVDNVFLNAFCKECDIDYKTIDGFDIHMLFNHDGSEVHSDKFLKDVPELYKYNEPTIPEKYIFNSRDIRYSLLRGIMDGYHGIDNWYETGTIIYRSSNRPLTKQIAFLVRSLGFKVVQDDDECNGKYRGKLSIHCGAHQRHLFYKNSANGFRTLATKFMPEDTIIPASYSANICAIKKLDYREDMHCLHVHDDRHLYQSTDFAVTCNTGKDSIAKMIASEWNRNMYYVTGGKGGNFIPNAIVDNSDAVNYPLFLVSDIDKYPFLINEPEMDIEKDQSPGKEDQMKYKQLFGTMINALDGVLSGEGRIIVMTTNHIEKFSDTFLRPGRIDLKLEIGYVTAEVFRKYVWDFYHKELPADIKLKNNKLTVADMQFDVVFLKLNFDEFVKKHVK